VSRKPEVCWQCGKPATELLWYYQGGKGWVQRPVCEMGDAHPWDVWVPAEVPELAGAAQ
jgi:thymidine kinase